PSILFGSIVHKWLFFRYTTGLQMGQQNPHVNQHRNWFFAALFSDDEFILAQQYHPSIKF
ncbi:hypothetical protein MXE00_15785, partial [Legionella pneumophila]